MKALSYSQVQQEFPEAWKALPEPYREDSCLQFHKDNEDILWASPKESEIQILGDWEAMWNPERSAKTWEQTE